MQGNRQQPLDDICGLECRCEFGHDPNDDDPPEQQYHYWRRCSVCRHVACAYLHCPHDNNQSSCVECGAQLRKIGTP